jgi:hypothetical protein
MQGSIPCQPTNKKSSMQSQDLTYQKIYAKLAKRTEKYAADVRNVYLKRMGEIARLCEGVEIPDGKVFHFNDYPEIATEAQKQLRSMYSELYQCVRGDVTREWYYANDDVDRLVKAMFGKEAAEQPHFAKYFQRNKQAMDAFFARKTEGMDLSQRVWRIVGEGKQEMELALDLGIGEGMDADALSREVRKYLQEPEKLFRRVRDKHGELVLSKAAKAYHPGQGVYRSSYKNAMRVTRTETNMAYRTADVTRWQQLPFVTGYEVKTSKSHEARMPKGDICDDLAGVYPKGFVFKGWHPHCLCYIVPKLCTDKELDELTGRILEGTEDEFTPAGIVEDVPSQFTQWVSNNAERIENAKSLPYFLRDNYPNGDVTKAGKWVQEIANETGMGNMAQVVAKSELELAKFTNVQAMSQEEWEACSNYVPAGSDELAELLNAKAGSAINAVSTLGDKATMDAILEQASKGVDVFGNWLSKEELAELQKVATMAKYATKQESKLVTHMGRKELEYALGGGKSAQFGQSLKFGTNYTKAAKGALAATEEEQVLVVVRTPAGSRYVQTMAGEAQQAVMLPNTKYKLLGTAEKTIVQAGGKTAKLMQYELELVDDGSSFVEQLVADNAKAQKELAAHAKAVKIGNNVLKVANKYSGFGVDTIELDTAIANGTTEEIKAAYQQLSKDINAAKKSIKATYSDYVADPVAVFNKWGKDGLDEVYSAVKTKIELLQNDVYHKGDLNWLKSKLEFEIKYVENPTQYKATAKQHKTWQEAQSAYKVQLHKVENQLALQNEGLLDKIDEAVTFAATSKSAKLKGLVKELQELAGSYNMDITAVKTKQQVVAKEMERLRKARAAKNKVEPLGGALSKEDVLECGIEAAQKYIGGIKAPTEAQKQLYAEIQQAYIDKDSAKLEKLLKNWKIDLSDPYSQARKDYAMWAKDTYEADQKLREKCKDVWLAARQEEKYGCYYYTHTYCPINEPLRGQTYIGNSTKLNEAQSQIPHITNMCNRSQYNFDMWVQRGVRYDNMLGVDLSSMSVSDAEHTLIGKVVEERAFCSCGVAKGTGFSSKPVIFNIYCPKGTKGMYLEPFSYYGHGVNGKLGTNYDDGIKWLGGKQASFGSESEILLQRGTKFKVTKINKSGGVWYVDVEVVEQPI